MKTIKSSLEISRLFKEGKRINTPEIILIASKVNDQHGQPGRVAFIAGKKLGNAVWRNRAKRRMRALCQEVGGPFPSFDVIFLAKNKVNDVAFSELKQHMLHALKKSGLNDD